MFVSIRKSPICRPVTARKDVAQGDARVSYVEYAPCEALRPFVACYWTMTAEVIPARGIEHRILPDGCTDILFEVDTNSHGNVVGYMTGHSVGLVRPPAHSVCARFRPGFAHLFLGCRADELTDRFVSLESFWARGASSVADQIGCARTTENRIDAIEQRLLSRIRTGINVDSLVLRCLCEIVKAGGRTRVDTLANSAGLTPRQLSRRFIQTVGVSTKTFCRGLPRGLLPGSSTACGRQRDGVGHQKGAKLSSTFPRSH